VTDVTQASRAQNRVRHGMQQDVGIGMAVRTDVRGNLHPTQDTGATGHQGVDVVTEADAERWLGHAFF